MYSSLYNTIMGARTDLHSQDITNQNASDRLFSLIKFADEKSWLATKKKLENNIKNWIDFTMNAGENKRKER